MFDFSALGSLSMFREGKDTHEISKRLGIPEAVVSREIWIARCFERGLPAEYREYNHPNLRSTFDAQGAWIR